MTKVFEIKKNRNYGVDLLRVVAMYMIFIMHIFNKIDLLYGENVFSVKYQVAWLLEIIAFCSVNCYILISGYVGFDAKYKYTNIIVLWLKVMFYSVGITLITRILLPAYVTKSVWKISLLPTISNEYWFFTSYLGLFIFMPIINKAIQSMSKKQCKYLVFIFVLLLSVVQTVVNKDIFGTGNGYSSLWFIVVYTIGAYIKKYDIMKEIKIRSLLFVYIGLVMMTWLSNVFIEVVSLRLLGSIKGKGLLVSYTSPTILCAAVVLLLLFCKINIPEKFTKVVLTLSSLTFSVYLLHGQTLITNNVLTRIASNVEVMNVFEMVLFMTIGIGGLYIICSVICLIEEMIFRVLRIKQKIYDVEKKYLGDIWE